MMDPLYLMPAVIFVGIVCYHSGRLRAIEPTEEEMYRRLVEARRTRILRKAAEEEVNGVISREAAR